MRLLYVILMLLFSCSTTNIKKPEKPLTDDEIDKRMQELLRRYCEYEQDRDPALCPPKKPLEKTKKIK